KEFCFVGRDVDPDRVITFAPFARKAEIEGMLDVFILPTPSYHVSLRHFPEQVGTTPGRVFLFVGGTIARAHQTTFGTSTLPYSDTTQVGMSQTGVILRIAEVSHWIPWLVVSP